MQEYQLLKQDLFGSISKVSERGESAILRDTRTARWWLQWLARSLMRREARALAVLTDIHGIPELLRNDENTLLRSFIPGAPLFDSRPTDATYFKAAAALLRKVHRAGIVHNDLAKEPNVLFCEDGSPAFIDFQLAAYSKQRGRLFRAAAREDIRHLLKHKRSYRPDLLTRRERMILASPSTASRLWMSSIKPLYVFVTRRLLRWSDREGAADRQKV